MVRHPSGFRKDDRDQVLSELPSSKRSAKEAGDYKGLCMNCTNRETCLLPKAEGGVWHCEEYVEDH